MTNLEDTEDWKWYQINEEEEKDLCKNLIEKVEKSNLDVKLAKCLKELTEEYRRRSEVINELQHERCSLTQIRNLESEKYGYIG